VSETRSDDPSSPSVRKAGRPPRNQEALLAAAADVFVSSGVDAPVRDIAARAGVGTGTIYRHFPTRADLVVAVYRHQVEACADAGPRLLADSASAEAAFRTWVSFFVDFLVTKHGLADALRGDSAGSDALHTYFVDRLVPVCGSLLEAALGRRAESTSLDPYSVLKGIGNLCIGAGADSRYDLESLIHAYVTGVLADGTRG